MDKVFVENDWYDGPRVGIANYKGVPHRFVSEFNDESGYTDSFLIYPISENEFKLEVEQWKIFVEWNTKYEKGEVNTESHPGHGGISSRWDEIENTLKESRENIPENAIKQIPIFEPIEQENRYEENGPCYCVIWQANQPNK